MVLWFCSPFGLMCVDRARFHQGAIYWIKCRLEWRGYVCLWYLLCSALWCWMRRRDTACTICLSLVIMWQILHARRVLNSEGVYFKRRQYWIWYARNRYILCLLYNLCSIFAERYFMINVLLFKLESTTCTVCCKKMFSIGFLTFQTNHSAETSVSAKVCTFASCRIIVIVWKHFSVWNSIQPARAQWSERNSTRLVQWLVN